MTESNTTTKPGTPSLITTILWAGFLVGTLDILTASANTYLFFGKGLIFVLKYVAMGIFGKNAMTGGADMAIYGLLIHYAIAYAFTIFFFLIYPNLGLITVNKVLTGILYGLFAWLVMNLIAVPYLSRVPQRPFHFNTQSAINIVILMVMIGLPLSFIANRYYSNTAKH